jgi:hypothetical protein
VQQIATKASQKSGHTNFKRRISSAKNQDVPNATGHTKNDPLICEDSAALGSREKSTYEAASFKSRIQIYFILKVVSESKAL